MYKNLDCNTATIAPIESLRYVKSAPNISAKLKVNFDDFKVEEYLGFEPTGSGDHLFIKLKKINLSTIEVARKLSETTGTKLSAIGYSGMKDKRGECTQWFSIPLKSKIESEIASLENEQVKIISSQPNIRKLKIGNHKENDFNIKLRGCQGDKYEFEDRLNRLMAHGVPNYFGMQRFGKKMKNVQIMVNLMEETQQIRDSKISQLLQHETRVKRGILISAARAYLFNQLLSNRIQLKNWSRYQPGDVLNLDGTDSYFLVPNDQWDETLQERLNSFDIHVSGPLAGHIFSQNKYVTRSKAADIENDSMENSSSILKGLMKLEVSASRRPLRFRPKNLRWSWQDGNILNVRFSLRRGCYATSLLREVCLTD